MKNIKCPNCGFISWATAETCKKCGGQLGGAEAMEIAPQIQNENARTDQPKAPANVPRLRKPVLVVLAVLIPVSIVVGLVALKTHRDGQPQTFTIKYKGQRTSRVWFHSWFSSDPSVDQIFAQYLKVSGRQANPSALKTYIAKGKFELKNEAQETLGETLTGPRLLVHIHWRPTDGDLEFEAQAPNKFIFTQKFAERIVFQRGTNGTTGWWRKGWTQSSDTEAGPDIQLVNTIYTGPLSGDNLTDLKRGADFVNYFQLENAYSRLYLAGKQLIGDRVAYEVQNRNGMSEAVTALYFDVETGMLLRFDSYRHEIPYNPNLDGYTDYYHNSPSEWSHIFLEDYREVNGVKIPFRIRQYFRDLWITTTITEFKANPTIDASVFEGPVINSTLPPIVSTQ